MRECLRLMLEGTEIKCFLPHSENEFNCRYCLTLNDITRNKENLSHNRFICGVDILIAVTPDSVTVIVISGGRSSML